MIDPYVELGGWMIAQAIEDICGEAVDVLPEDRLTAWDFLLYDPFVDEILEYIDYGGHTTDKRSYILQVVIPSRLLKQVYIANFALPN